jgi:enoyl-[acyl-carrier protein] reductase I
MLARGKRILVTGLADHNSIAWGITESLAREGAEGLAFLYQQRFENNVRKLASGIPGALLVETDITVPESLDVAFSRIATEWGRLDGLVHCIAAARREELAGDFVRTSRDGFLFAQEVSAYSLVELSRRAVPLMEKAGGGSILCLSYLGGQRVVPNYNVMGVAKASLEMAMRYLAADLGRSSIRVNALSSAPVRTISARGIDGISDVFRLMEERSPLRRNVTKEEVGDAALFLLSDLSRAVTGTVLFVDNGFHILGA